MNKKIIIVICIIFLLSLFLPLVYLAFHVFPATDDFGFATSLRDSNIWSNSKSIYLTMDNRLCGNFITLLFSHSDTLFIHRFQFVIFILLLFSSIYMVLFEINRLYLKTSKSNIFILFTFFSFLYIAYNPGLNEAFFWYPGVAVWSSSLLLFNTLIYCALKIITTEKFKSFFFVIISFLLFVLTSQNEIMFLLMFVISLFLIYYYFTPEGKFYRKQIILLLLVLAVGAAIVIFGPGNYVRLKFISNKQPVTLLAVFISNALLYRKIFFLSDVLIINMLLVPFYYYFSVKVKSFLKPGMLLLFSIFLLFIFVLPSIIAKTLYTFRIQNVVYYLSLILIFINFVNFSVFLRLKSIVILKYSNKYLVILVVFLSMTYFLQKESVIRTVYFDIISKKIENYSNEMIDREKTILNCKNDTVYVLSIQIKPKSIFIDDISTDNTDWRNSVYNSFYKKTIILK
jgi:hypothetical protein